ncbi:siderophore-interacting protein [Corynebacterium sp. sy039]|nr:siderophore-interacting protein [Corynebacterium sp. sy039]
MNTMDKSPIGLPKNSKKKPRVAQEATITAKTSISEHMIRLSFHAKALIGKEFPFSDHYVKLLFIPQGAPYSIPFNLADIQQNYPPEQQPIKRTYTLRNIDPGTGNFDIDFVSHGDIGLAGPWAARAQVGEKIMFLGPGGKWKPEEKYPHFIFAGDEAAAPAIIESLQALPQSSTAEVFLEIAHDNAHIPVPENHNITYHWVPRQGAVHGTQLMQAVRHADYDWSVSTSWFVHGVAEMIKDIRRFLFVEHNVSPADVSISGYWRLGMTEDQWQASKGEFNRSIEAEENALKK